MRLYDLWVCFIISLVLFSVPPTFHIHVSEPVATESQCRRVGQSDIPIPRGEELVLVTPCLKIPDRRKA
jgi:hypothetical protein